MRSSAALSRSVITNMSVMQTMLPVFLELSREKKRGSDWMNVREWKIMRENEYRGRRKKKKTETDKEWMRENMRERTEKKKRWNQSLLWRIAPSVKTNEEWKPCVSCPELPCGGVMVVSPAWSRCKLNPKFSYLFNKVLYIISFEFLSPGFIVMDIIKEKKRKKKQT